MARRRHGEIRVPDITLENLQFYLVFVLPGFVVLKTYDLLVPREHRDFSGSVIEIVAYSIVNLALVNPLLPLLEGGEFASEQPHLFYLRAVAILFLPPITIAVIIFKLRNAPWMLRFIRHPLPSGWDFYFGQRKKCWVLFHLKSGELVGGLFDVDSFASAYPRDPEIYLRNVWAVDRSGKFKHRIEESDGIIVRAAECSLVEFFAFGDSDEATAAETEENGTPRRLSPQRQGRDRSDSPQKRHRRRKKGPA